MMTKKQDALLKILIVDDEYLVRSLLIKCIDWDTGGFELAGEAAGSYEALDMIGENVPHIVITDICMPYLNGIDLSKQIMKNYPQIKVIVLTGHDEFEYAKESIKAQIFDYILKPIDKKEIMKVLTEIKKKIIEEKIHDNEFLRLKKIHDDNLPILKEKFFDDLFMNKLTEEEISRKMAYFQLHFRRPGFQVCIIEVDYHKKSGHLPDEEKLYLLKWKAMEIVKFYYQAFDYVHIVWGQRQNIVVFINHHHNSALNNIGYLKKLISVRLQCMVSMGISNLVNDIKSVHQAYRQAETAMEYKIIEGKEQIIYYQDITISKNNDIVFQEEETFQFYLRAGLNDQLVSILEQYFQRENWETSLTVDRLRSAASYILSIIFNVLFSTGLDVQENTIDVRGAFDKIFRLDSLPAVKQYLIRLVTEVTDIINRIDSNNVSSLITRMQDWIIENISDPHLSLSKAAEIFCHNTSYLSRKFKQETGLTFKDYLAGKKMERAIVLLKETDDKVYEIAEKIGIIDPHYFSIFFKKHMKMSISEYRQKVKKVTNYVKPVN